MNVLILTKSFPERPGDWGGIFVRDQAEAIAKRHSVTVVKCRVDYQNFNPFFNFRIESENGLHYRYFCIIVSKSFPVYNQLNYIISVYLALKTIINEWHPSVIHCHYSYPAGIIAWLVKRKAGIPYLVTEHSRIRSTFRSIFHRALSIVALKKANCVIAVSNFLKKEIVNEGINEVRVIPNVVEIERFEVTNKNSVPFIIGFLGSLNTHNKGLDILLDACSDLPFEYIIKIGGEGTNLDYYKNMAAGIKLKGRAVFLGGISTQDRRHFYSDINVFVLASRYETFGIVLLEAMASGIPVVATRCGGPEEIIDERYGALTDVGDAVNMKQNILKIYDTYSSYKPVEIRNYINKKFGYEAFLEKIERAYKECSTTA